MHFYMQMLVHRISVCLIAFKSHGSSLCNSFACGFAENSYVVCGIVCNVHVHKHKSAICAAVVNIYAAVLCITAQIFSGEWTFYNTGSTLEEIQSGMKLSFVQT